MLGLTTKKVRSVKHEERGILLDEERVTVRARGKEGQLLKVMLEDSQEKQSKIAPVKMNLHILYEDEDLLFVDKPTGIVSHPSKGHTCDSLINGVQAYFEEKGSFNNKRSNIHLIGISRTPFSGRFPFTSARYSFTKTPVFLCLISLSAVTLFLKSQWKR